MGNAYPRIPKPSNEIRAALLKTAKALEKQAEYLRQVANGEHPVTAGHWCTVCRNPYGLGVCPPTAPCKYSLESTKLGDKTV